MASSNSIHLSEEQLARLEDGELSGREAGHLESCEECRRRLNGLRAATAAYSKYLNSIRRPLLPPPPKPWPSFDVLVRQHQEASSARKFRWWPAPALAAALCLLVAVVILYKLLPYGHADEPSIRATELLTQSAGIELPEGREISLRVGDGRAWIRPAVLTSSSAAENDPGTTDVRSVFASAHYSWREPLSARSFQSWRAGLKNKRDFVSVVRAQDEKESYRVRTDSQAGPLRSASLMLRMKDLHPTEGRFEFDALGTVEIAETAVPTQGAEPLRPSPERPSAATPQTEMPLGPEDTLHVLAALDKIGADVGDPIEVSEDARRKHVIVRSNGLSPQRQQEIAQALTPLPRVILGFATGASGSLPPRLTTPEKYSASIPESLRQQLEDRLGGATARQEITDRVLEASALILARAHAVELLAGKFSPEIEAQLHEQDRGLLHELRDNHVVELGRLVTRIRADLKPLLAASTGVLVPPATDRDEVEQVWQARVSALVASAQETDKLLNRLLAGSYSQSSGEEMLSRLTSQIDRLAWTIRLQRQAGR
jgi:hypothetical protein